MVINNTVIMGNIKFTIASQAKHIHEFTSLRSSDYQIL